MKKFIIRVAPVAAFTCVAVPSIAAEPTAPFTAEKNAASEYLLSFQLERRFDRLISDCSIPKPLKMKKGDNNRTVSAIDADVIDSLRLNLPLGSQPAIYAPVESNLARVFGYVFQEEEKDAPTFVNDNFLKIDYREEPAEGLAPGFPQLRLEASCGSVIQAAMDANAGYDFGIGSVKAALDAEFDSEQEVTFQIASGRFLSPIWEMWTGTNIEQANQSAKKFYAATLFWNWYQQSARNGKFYLLEDFYGTTLYRQLARNKRSGVSASTEARLQVPFFTGSGGTSGSIRHDEEMRAQDFAIYLSKRAPGGGKSTTYRQLPALEDVIAAAAANTSSEYYPQDAAGRLVQAGQSRSFYHDVRHLPSSYCEQNAWQVRDTAAAAAQSTIMVLEGIDRVTVEDRNVCRFRMAYTPEDFTLDSDVTLTPHLFTTAQAANKRLVLKLKPISFSRRLTPIVAWASGNGKPEIVQQSQTPPSYRLNWQWQLSLTDDGRYRDINRIHVSGLHFSCPADTLSGGVPNFSPAWIDGEQGEPRTLVIRGSAFYHGALPTDPKFAACTLGGTIRFIPNVAGEKPVMRNVPANIPVLYPQKGVP